MDKQTQQNLLNIVKHNYETIAEEFNQTRKKLVWPELINLAGHVKAGDSILDVGCGNGRLAMVLANKNIKYLGVDSSEKLIALADKNIKALNFKFTVANILELDKQVAQTNFDYIYCVAVLHHLPGQDLQIKALEQLKNKLSPAGELILTNWYLWGQLKYLKIILKYFILKIIGKNQMDFGDVLFDWDKGVKSQRYYHVFTKRGLKKLAKKTGLKIKKLYKDKYNYYLVLIK